MGKNWHEIVVYESEVVPNYVRIFEGTPVTAYCGSSVPVIWTYQNSKSAVETYLSHDYYVEKNSHLYHIIDKAIVLSNLKKGDTGKFHCHGTFRDKAGESSRFSSPMRISVVDHRVQIPNIIIPIYAEVPLGGTITLSCKSDHPDGVIQYSPCVSQ